MNLALKAVGIVLVCVGIHFGLALPWLIVFGAGLGFLFLV